MTSVKQLCLLKHFSSDELDKRVTHPSDAVTEAAGKEGLSKPQMGRLSLGIRGHQHPQEKWITSYCVASNAMLGKMPCQAMGESPDTF